MDDLGGKPTIFGSTPVWDTSNPGGLGLGIFDQAWRMSMSKGGQPGED